MICQKKRRLINDSHRSLTEWKDDQGVVSTVDSSSQETSLFQIFFYGKKVGKAPTASVLFIKQYVTRGTDKFKSSNKKGEIYVQNGRQFINSVEHGLRRWIAFR